MGYSVDLGSPGPPKYLANSAGYGSIAWVGSSVALGAGQTSNWLLVSSFNHILPSNGTLDGFSLALTGSASVLGAISDNSVRLIRLGTSSTADSGGSYSWGTSNIRQIFAGSSNLWGFTNWTITNPNVSNSTAGHGWLIAFVNVSAASATFTYSQAESLVHFSITDNTTWSSGISLGAGRF